MADPQAEVHLSTQIDKMMSIRNGLIRNRGNCMITHMKPVFDNILILLHPTLFVSYEY